MTPSLQLILVVLSTAVGTFAFFPYARDIFLKKTKPHAYTWLIWTLTQGTAVAGMWHGKGGIGAIELTVGTAFVFLTFLVSLKYGTKNITRSDTVFLVISLLAIGAWWLLNNPLLAVVLVTLIDFFGFVPTFRKSWAEPWSETILTWVLFTIANIFAIAALGEYNLLTLTYIVMITIMNTAVVILCLVRRKMHKPKES